MRIPILIETIGPAESSWVSRRGLRKVHVRGNGTEIIVLQSDCGAQLALGKEGTFDLPEYWEGTRVKARIPLGVTVNIDLLR